MMAAALIAGLAAHADVVAGATNPLAAFALQEASGTRAVNGDTTTHGNGASMAPANGGPQADATSLHGGAIEYIAGASRSGNDCDLQLTRDSAAPENLCCDTDAGSSICAALPVATLLDAWHMVTATDNSTTGEQDIYCDGALAATNNRGTPGSKTCRFTIGYRSVSSNRDFGGLISDVGVLELSADRRSGRRNS